MKPIAEFPGLKLDGFLVLGVAGAIAAVALWWRYRFSLCTGGGAGGVTTAAGTGDN